MSRLRYEPRYEPRYETVIGLEVHAQLRTASKLFSPMAATYGEAPNSRVNEICAGMPGVLPVLNREAVACAIQVGLALECEIRTFSQFARKNYFYPDLPKGYQISQFEKPICENGRLFFMVDSDERECGITRVHMEEDAGKSVHEPGKAVSRVDLNRAGVPLVEIVSEPDLRTPEEAVGYLKELRNILMTIGVCDGNMEEGSFRCDANISVRPHGQQELGVKVEIKNMNSFKFLKDALTYEHSRQVACLEEGEPIVQETRLWRTDSRQTVTMRRKEGSDDYRYFPDPDLPPLVISEDWIASIRDEMVELPRSRRQRYVTNYGLSLDTAIRLATSRPVAEYFESAVGHGGRATAIGNWIMTDVLAIIARDADVTDLLVTPAHLSELVQLIDAGDISGKMAKDVFATMVDSGESPAAVVERKGLKVVRDTGELGAIVDEILADNTKQVAEYRAGKTKLKGFFVGQVMRATKGKADPALVQQILQEKLSQ